jgi:hypothetical protein
MPMQACRGSQERVVAVVPVLFGRQRRCSVAAERSGFEDLGDLGMPMQTSAEATKADAPDRVEILHAIGLYVDGFNDGDASKFTEAFHEDAWIFYSDAEGTLHRQLVAEAFDEWAAERRPITGRIRCVTQAGDIASVLLDFDDADEPTNRWVDLHALVRVAGVWKITNKTATHRSRAGRSEV